MPLLQRPRIPIVVLALVAIHVVLDAQELPGCRRGTYLAANLSRCMPCTDNVNFMDEEYNRQPQCHECSTCIGIMVLAAACNVSHDTLCHCPNGYVRTIENLCRPVQHGEEDRSSLAETTGSRSERTIAERPFVDSKLDQLKTIGYVILFFILLIIVAGIWLFIICFSRRMKIDEKLMQRVEDLIGMVRPHVNDSRDSQNAQRISAAPSSSRIYDQMRDEDREESSRSLMNKNGAHQLRSGSSVVLHKKQGSSVTLGALSVA